LSIIPDTDFINTYRWGNLIEEIIDDKPNNLNNKDFHSGTSFGHRGHFSVLNAQNEGGNWALDRDFIL